MQRDSDLNAARGLPRQSCSWGGEAVPEIPSAQNSVLQSPVPASRLELNEGFSWYAVYTCARHEKRVKQQLDLLRIRCALPLYRAVHRWKDRRKELGVRQAIICKAAPPREMLRRIWAASDLLGLSVRVLPPIEEMLKEQNNTFNFRNIDMNVLLGRQPLDSSGDNAAVLAAYRGKRILITGAGGSIGSELALQPSHFGPRALLLLDNDENGLNDTFSRLRNAGEVSAVVTDLRFGDRLQSVLRSFRPEVVFHAGAHKHVHLMETKPLRGHHRQRDRDAKSGGAIHCDRSVTLCAGLNRQGRESYFGDGGLEEALRDDGAIAELSQPPAVLLRAIWKCSGEPRQCGADLSGADPPWRSSNRHPPGSRTFSNDDS